MAGQKQDKSDQEVTKNGSDPANQVEEENVIEEYITLDSKLDELNSALDFLEQKNDDIHAKLKELLQSNIEIRQELRNENNKMETEENN